MNKALKSSLLFFSCYLRKCETQTTLIRKNAKKSIVILRLIMGITKTEQFTEEQNHLALIAKAIAHPARIAILEHLFKIKSCVCGDIVNKIGLAQATISQHLKALKDAGLIKGNIDGTKVCYCIDTENLNNLSNILSHFFKSGSCTDCC